MTKYFTDDLAIKIEYSRHRHDIRKCENGANKEHVIVSSGEIIKGTGG